MRSVRLLSWAASRSRPHRTVGSFSVQFRCFSEGAGTRRQWPLPGATDKECYALAFTCKVCDTRAARMISKKAYHHGVVLVQCPECKNRHLISDQLKWFGDETSNIETILADRGEAISKMGFHEACGVDADLIHVEGGSALE
mmetsp:Transcript_167/g.445  ORF Transcript_167/g.445 Transcript_167/m.445 type:complete len:142 (-) Transcript_167:113-538(-)